jgi:ubiquinone/menaquinone biosynthesis C-methylase UbiE
MPSQKPSSIPVEVWQTSGSSEHMGGTAATRRLLEMCALGIGKQVLDIGCGTGGTLILLAEEFKAHTTGVDLTIEVLRQAHERIAKNDAQDRVRLILADGGCLPLATEAFDCVVIQSVLVHSAAGRILAEALRVLIPGGRLCVNEMTYLTSPAHELEDLLENQLGIKAHTPARWQEIFMDAGFRISVSESRRFNLWEQLRNHLIEDGILGYLSALRKGLSSSRLRNAFLNRKMLSAARRFSKAVGYGLFVLEKPLD